MYLKKKKCCNLEEQVFGADTYVYILCIAGKPDEAIGRETKLWN